MKALRCICQDKKGEGYIDVAIAALIIFVLMAGLLTFFPLFTTQQSLNVSARQLARIAEVTGGDSTDFEEAYNNLPSIKPDNIEWDTTWYNEADRTIQLKTPFTIKLKKSVKIILFRPAFSEPFGFDITISSLASGISEVYYK